MKIKFHIFEKKKSGVKCKLHRCYLFGLKIFKLKKWKKLVMLTNLFCYFTTILSFKILIQTCLNLKKNPSKIRRKTCCIVFKCLLKFSEGKTILVCILVTNVSFYS